MTRSPAESGFSLIESLVALAILALTAIAIIGATEAHISRIAGLTTRAAAQWTAENHIALRELGLDDTAPPPMLGISFAVVDTQQPTSDPEVVKVDTRVTDLSQNRSYGGFTWFLDIGSAHVEPLK